MNAVQIQVALGALPLSVLNGIYRQATGDASAVSRSVMVSALVPLIKSGTVSLPGQHASAAQAGAMPVAPSARPAVLPPVSTYAPASQVQAIAAEVSRLEQIIRTTQQTQVSEGTIDAKLAGALHSHQQAAQSLRATVATLEARLAQAEADARTQAETVAAATAALAPKAQEVAEEVRRAAREALAPFVAQVVAEGRAEEVAQAVAGPVSQGSALDVFGIDVRDAQGRVMLFDVWGHPDAPPVDPVYIWTEDTVRLLHLAQSTGRNFWLGGPAGTGKTQAVQQFAARTGRLFRRFVFDRLSTREDYLGSMGLEQGSTIFREGPVLEVFQTPGAVCLLDEVGMGQAQALSSLNGWLEPKARMTYEGKTYTRAPGSLFAACDNSLQQGDTSGRYAGVNAMNVAFGERFSWVHPMKYLDPQVEAQALRKHTGCSAKLARHVVDAITVCRSKVDSGEMIDAPSIRQAIAFVEACRVLPVAQAWHLSIAARQPAESSVALGAVYAASINEALITQEIAK